MKALNKVKLMVAVKKELLKEIGSYSRIEVFLNEVGVAQVDGFSLYASEETILDSRIEKTPIDNLIRIAKDELNMDISNFV